MPDPIKKYKTPNGKYVGADVLQQKYADKFKDLVADGTFTEVNEPLYKSPNGKIVLESVLQEKYGERLEVLKKDKTFTLDYSPKKKDVSEVTSQSQKSVSEAQDTNGSSDIAEPNKSTENKYDTYLDSLENNLGQDIVSQKTFQNKAEIERNINAINELYAFEDVNATAIKDAEARQNKNFDPLANQPQEVVDAYNKFRSLEKLDEVALAEIDQRIKEEQQGDFGFFSNTWNKAKELVGFNDTRQASKKEELIKERIERNRTDFLNELDNPKLRKAVADIRLKEQFRNDQSLKDSEILIQKKALQTNALIERINRINDNQNNLIKGLKTEKDPKVRESIIKEAQQNEENYKALSEQIETLKIEAESVINDIENGKSSIGTFEDELDLLKRNYQWLDNQKEVLRLGFADAANSFKYTFNNIKLGITDGDNIIRKATDDYENKIEANKKQALEFRAFTNQKRDLIEKKLEVSQIESVSDFGQFTVESTVENIPTLAQFAAGRAGIGSFFVSQQASEELDIRQGVIDDKKALQQYNDILNNPDIRKNYSSKELSNMERQRANILGKRKLTELDIATMSSVFAGSEIALGYLGKIRLVNKGKRVAQSIGQTELKTLAQQNIIRNIGKQSWDLVKDASGEGFEELGTGTLKNIVEIAYVGDKIDESGNERTVADGGFDNFVGGFAVGGNISGTTKAVGNALGMVADKKRRATVAENTISAIKLLEQSEVPGLTADAKNVLIDEANILFQKNAEIINKTEEEFKNLNPEQKKEIRDINTKIQSLNISKEKIKDESSKDLIDQKLENLEEQKAELLNPSDAKTETPTAKETKPTVEDTTPISESKQENVKPTTTNKIENKTLKTDENQENQEVLERVQESERKESGSQGQLQEEIDETTPQNDTSINGEDGPAIEPSVQQGQKNNTQSAIDTTTSEVKTEVKPVTITRGKNNYTVSKNDTGITVLDKNGKSPSKPTERAVLKEYADTIDLTQGQKYTPQEGQTISDVDTEIANNSNNPSELAEVALRTKQETFIEENSDTRAIQVIEYVQQNVKRDSFINISDKNNITNAIGRSYFNNKGRSLDVLAKELSEDMGVEITEQDIVDIILQYPNGINDVKKEVRDKYSNPAKQRFTEITGLPASDIYLEKAVNQAIEKENLDAELNNNYLLNLSDAELMALEQESLDYEKATFQGPKSSQKTTNTSRSKEESKVQKSVDAKKPSKAERKAAANAKVDEVVDAINSIDTINLFGKDIKIKIDDVDGINQNGHDFVAIIASIVKQAIAAGIEIDVAIENTIAHFKSKFNVDVNAEDVKAKLEPKKKTSTKANPKKPNERQKSVLTKAAKGGKNPKLQKGLEKHGLTYAVESQELAKAKAQAYVKDVGTDTAIEMLKSGVLQPGAELAFVYSEVIDAIEKQLDNTTDASKKALQDTYVKLQEEVFVAMDSQAREFGRFISALRNVYQSSYYEYSLEKQIQKYKAREAENLDANGNIPADVLAKFKERDAKLKEFEKRISELEQQLENAQDQQAVDDIVESVEREKKQTTQKISKSRAKQIAAAVRKAKVRRNFDDFNNLQSSPLELLIVAYDGAIETFASVLDQTGNLELAIKKALNQLKNSDIYKKLSKADKKKIENKLNTEINSYTQETFEVSIDENNEISIPNKLIRQYVANGYTDIESLTEAIKNDYFSDEDVSSRQVRDAITGYGKTINPTKDELSEEISKLKNLGKILSGMEDVKNGQRPKRSGYQRRKKTDEERRKEKALKDAMRDLPIDEGDIEKEWKSQLDAVKSRLKNQISDLAEQIKNREKSKPERQPIEYDYEAKQLREERDRLKAILEDIVGKPELSYEDKVKRSENALENSIEKLEKDIEANNIAFKEKTSVTSPKIEALKKRKAELTAQLNQMRKESGLIDKKRLDNRKKALATRLKQLQEKRANKDYSKKKREPLPEDKELRELRRKYEKEKEKYDQEAYEHELKNMSPLKKVWKQVVNFLGLQRVLLATGEFSFVFLQNAVPTVNLALRNPVKLFKIIAQTVKSYSNSKFEKDYAPLENHDLFELAKKSRLALTRTNYKMNAKEEVFQSDMVTSMFKILGKTIDRSGNKKLTLFDTVMKAVGKDVSNKKRFTTQEQIENSNPFAAMERFTTTYGNHIKMELFTKGVKSLEIEGKNPIDNKKDYERLANAINTLTGRANLGRFDSISPELNALFFSVRFATSTFNKLNPIYYAGVLRDSENPTKISVAQKMAISQMLTYVATTTSFILAVQALGGEDEEGNNVVEIETNPTSSDFGKLKIGNIRFDPWGGHIPWVNLISRIATGKMKKSNGKVVKLGEGSNDTRFDKIIDFGVGKANPTVATGIRFMRASEDIDGVKRDRFGNEVSVEEELKNLYPIYWQGIQEVIEEDPKKGKELAFALTGLGLLGVNNQVYGSNPKYLLKGFAKDTKNEMNAKRQQLTRPNKKELTSAEELDSNFKAFKQKHEENYIALIKRVKQNKESMSLMEIDKLLKLGGHSEDAVSDIIMGIIPEMTEYKESSLENNITNLKLRLSNKELENFETIKKDLRNKVRHYNIKSSIYNMKDRYKVKVESKE